MLAEFSFTPSIFDESAHEDREAWREQLLRLGLNMFPQTGACAVMVSPVLVLINAAPARPCAQSTWCVMRVVALEAAFTLGVPL